MTGPKLSTSDNANPLAVGPQIFFRPVPSYVDVMYGITSTETYTVPDGAKYLVFSADGDFYCNPNGAAVVPTTEIANGSGSELNPVGYTVSGGESLRFIASVSTIVTISVYEK